MPLTVQALDHLVVNVSDVEASAAWCARVLGMTRMDVASTDGKPPRTEMRFGRQKINLRPIAVTKQDWFTADHEAAGAMTCASSPPRRPMSRSRRDRGRSGSEKGRPRNAHVGLLPRPRRQPDRDRVIPGRLADRRPRAHLPTTPS